MRTLSRKMDTQFFREEKKMIYTLENYILFSLIYSSVKEGRFSSQEYDSDILVEIFKTSIIDKENIFEVSENKKLEMIKKSAKILQNRNSRINIEKRIENMKSLFIETDKLNNLAKKIPLEIDLLEKNNIKTIDYEDEKYPKHLKEINNPPFIIFYKGYFPNDRELEKSLAIIGTRNPEEKYGREVARRVGKTLLDEGWWNISGLAVGCDEYGHKGSIGATGAILAQGLATPIFPKENTDLAKEILDNGGFLMSELPPSIKPNATFFVLRDRLQSGLTRGIFVVETSCKSGTLHTVKYALEQNRKTFIWNPIFVKDLQNENEVQGNIGLLDKTGKKYEFNVTIPKQLKQHTIPVKNNKHLLEYLKKIESEIKFEKNREEFLQNKLF